MVNLLAVAILLIVVVVVALVIIFVNPSAIQTSTSSTYYTTTIPKTTTTIASQEVSGNVSFTSYSCTSSVDSYGIQIYNLKVSGTAAGSGNATLSLSTNPISGDPVITCGSWEVVPLWSDNSLSNNCKRASDSQSSTSWSFSVYNMTKGVIDQQSRGVVYVDAQENIFNGSDYTHLANGSVTVPCT